MKKFKVAKFGGSSMANCQQITKVKNIIESDPEIKYVVVSAPGARWKGDTKITDILYNLHSSMIENKDKERDHFQNLVIERFQNIAKDFGITEKIQSYLDIFLKAIQNKESLEYIVSRGEYLSAVILATILDFDFIDATNLFVFSSNGMLDSIETKQKIESSQILPPKKGIVVPGFYGADMSGRIHLFSRGGSDVSGAIIASAVNASMYENWTDVSGILMADPKIVTLPPKIETMSYQEVRELSYMGANVFHPEAMFPLKKVGIPINIKNTNDPVDCGTIITSPDKLSKRPVGFIVGIAGRKNFTVINLEKMLMNETAGYVQKISTILEKHNVNFEHMPGGIDTLSIVVSDKEIVGKLEKVIHDINEKCLSDSITVESGMSVICTVGYDMANNPDIATKIFSAIAKKNIKYRMINYVSSKNNIIIGVNCEDHEQAIRAIYEAFHG